MACSFSLMTNRAKSSAKHSLNCLTGTHQQSELLGLETYWGRQKTLLNA